MQNRKKHLIRMLALFSQTGKKKGPLHPSNSLYPSEKLYPSDGNKNP